MTIAVTVFRMAYVSALAAGLLLAAAGLLRPGGTPQAFAQADTTAPTISSIAITSDTGDDNSYRRRDALGVYSIGDSIQITVTFNEDVSVTGAPQLELAIGSSNRTAEYESTDGSAAVFSYTVAEGDSDSDGIAVASNKLSLNGGSIKDAAGNDANLSHNALAAQDGHMVDGIRPTVSAISIFSGGAGYDDVFNIGDEMFANIRFSEAVRIGGEPQLTLDFDGEAKTAEWIGDLFFDFSYLIQEGDLDTDGVAIGANALSLNGGTIKDAAGNDAVLTHDAVGAAPYIVVDGVRPTVSSIAITSDPGEDDTYGTGDKIEVTVTFSEKMIVPVVAGDCPDAPDYCMPQLELDIGGEARTAEYQNTKGAAVVFAYNVQAGDTDENGIAIRSNKLTLNGGRIEDAVGIGIGANLADVSHAAVAADTGHKVVGPSLPLTLSGITMTEHQENDDMSVATYWVSGSDAAITWSLSGDDSDDFSIDKNMWQNGVLRFTSPPNYENPTDADTDNLYRVTIQASDGTNASTLQIVVLVRNVWLDADEVPVISGTVRVGETLTADTSRISRPFSLGPWYWWIGSDGTTDTEIEGATGASYTLTDADAGKTVKVRVNFYVKHSVNFGFVSLTSEATAMVAALGAEPNSLATGAPVIGGTAQVGETLTVDTSGIDDADGISNATFSYQWIAGTTDISGATGSSYAPLVADLGKTIKVRVTFTDDEGNAETLTSAATGAVAPRPNRPATGAPTIGGTAQVGETLKVDTSSIADADGLTGATFSYQWLSSRDTEIEGATSSTYTLAGADEGKAIRVRVSFTDDAGNRETLTSAATEAVAGAEPAERPGKPTGLSAAEVSHDRVTITWDDPGDSTITGYVILRRQHDTHAQGEFSTLAADTGTAETAYTDAGVEPGKRYTYRIKAINAKGKSERSRWLHLDTPAAPAAEPNSPATGTPSINGTAQVGETLSADTSNVSDADGLDNATFAYQWLADGADISGATDSTHTLADADEGKAMSVKVSFSDDRGNEETLTSAATEAVAGAEPAERPGKPTGLSAAEVSHDRVTITWDDPGDSTITGYVILRRQHDTHAQGEFSTLAADTGTAETAYTDAGVEPGKRYTYRIKAINAKGKSERSRWLHLDTPAAPAAEPNSPATGTPSINGTAQVGETLSADTSNVSDADGLDNATFAYQWLADDTDISGATNATYTLGEADKGKAVKVRVSFTDDGGDSEELTSAATDPVAAAEPSEPPAKPRGLSATATHDTVTLTWDDPDDDSITGYVVLRRVRVNDTGGEFSVLVPDTGTAATTYTDGTVVAETTYTYRIKAINEHGVSERSRWLHVDTPEAPEPDTPPERENSPATGAPTINGTARVGETLTADTSGIADEDGLEDATFTYRWLGDGSAIQDATANTYTLADTDQGKAVRVRVSFTDDAGNDETLTSEATGAVEAKPNSPATGEPTISGIAQVGETLTADTSNIEDADGLDDVAFSYQWLADGADISGATDSTHTLADADEGKAMSVKVSFSDDRGNEETLTSAATDAVAGLPPPPLTASLENVATSHDGESAFTFELRFSEEFGLSYKTLRDHAFTVTGGTVKNAQRLEQGSNVGWRITVQPSGNGDVTIILPETTDCDAQGAICTEDGRKLSHRLELTVGGPGQ